MRAKELLRRYEQGERNFQRINLRGQSFKGQDLSGADFTEADIRGANFTGANLTGARFCQAKAGLQKRWAIALVLVSWVMAVASGLTSVNVAASVISLFDLQNMSNHIYGGIKLPIYGGIALLFFIIFLVLIIRKGLAPVVVAGVFAGVFVLAFLSGITGALALLPFFALSFAINVGIAIAGVVAGAFAGSFAVAVGGFFAVAGAFIFTFAVAVVIAGGFIVAGFFHISLAVIIAVAVAVAGVSLYIGWRAMRGKPKDAWVRSVAVAFAATGGTSFHQADLTDADFTGAKLKSTNLRAATLIRTCFKNTIKLDQVRPGKTLLENTAVRELLRTGNGYKQDYSNTNLSGAYLVGANLEQVNLRLADLSEANLQQANLKDANLTKTNSVGTNFTGAYFTGACLEAWNIDSTTILDNIDCQYVFLLEHPNQYGSRDRRPHDQDKVFEPGDFEKLYKKLMHIVQILLRNGFNSEAFNLAFARIMEENLEIIYDNIREFEKKDNDVLVTLEVPEETDKGQIERNFLEAYEARFEAEKHYSKKLEELLAFGSTINLGTISGHVTNTINELPSSEEGNELKELLTQLKELLISAPDIKEEDKTEALEQVQTLAEAAKNPQDGAMKKAANTAVKIIRGTVTNLPTATKLVEESGKLLQAIASLLGLG